MFRSGLPGNGQMIALKFHDSASKGVAINNAKTCVEEELAKVARRRASRFSTGWLWGSVPSKE
eukprot:8723468-Lingulodinium_polyedra.AAC.1